jgi:threonine dehydrogenase-like Zn-dependent dehydrogenase
MRVNNDHMTSITFAVNPARWIACKAISRFWKPVYLSKIGGLRLRETLLPKLPGDDWVLCQTLLGGICGTDINMVYMNQHPASIIRNFVSMPIMLGHENVARVVEVGSAVKGIESGMRIIADPPLACAARKIDPPCQACREGKPSTCWNFDRGAIPPALGLGYNNFTGGSFSTYFVAHASQIHPLPEAIPDEQAILIDPIACSLHAVLRDLPKPNEKILVFGAGIIAMGIIQSLRALNLPITIVATVRHPFQADLARRCGADEVIFWKKSDVGAGMEEMAKITDARNMVGKMNLRYLQGGFDRLYDCTGKISGLVESQRLLRSGGTLIITGTPQLGLIDLTASWFRELKILGVTGRAIETLPGENAPRHNYHHVMSLIQEKKMDLSFLPLKFYRQQEYRQAFTDLQTRGRSGIVKAAFDFR